MRVLVSSASSPASRAVSSPQGAQTVRHWSCVVSRSQTAIERSCVWACYWARHLFPAVEAIAHTGGRPTSTMATPLVNVRMLLSSRGQRARQPVGLVLVLLLPPLLFLLPLPLLSPVPAPLSLLLPPPPPSPLPSPFPSFSSPLPCLSHSPPLPFPSFSSPLPAVLLLLPGQFRKSRVRPHLGAAVTSHYLQNSAESRGCTPAALWVPLVSCPSLPASSPASGQRAKGLQSPSAVKQAHLHIPPPTQVLQSSRKGVCIRRTSPCRQPHCPLALYRHRSHWPLCPCSRRYHLKPVLPLLPPLWLALHWLRLKPLQTNYHNPIPRHHH